MGSRKILVILLAGLVAFSPLAAACLPGGVASPFFAPISIRGNSELTAARGVASGSGTPADPYVIENRDLVYPVTPAVVITGTTAHLLLRNLRVTYAPAAGIESTSCCYAAISIWSSSNVTMENVTVVGGQRGIEIAYSHDIGVLKSHLTGNPYGGIYARSTTRLNLQGNVLTNGTIRLEGDALEHFASHSISADNTVDGLPFSYHANCNGQPSFPPAFGAVIVANCTGLRLAGVEASPVTAPVTVYYSDDAEIRNLTAGPLTLQGGVGDRIVGSTVPSIFLRGLTDATVEGNTVCDGPSTGLSMQSGTGVVVRNNTICRHPYDGIAGGDFPPDLTPVYNVIIENNTIFDNNRSGISLLNGASVLIARNVLQNNSGGIRCEAVDRADILENVVSGDRGTGIRAGGQDPRIERNRLDGSGISLYGSARPVVRANIVNTTWEGVGLADAVDATVEGNTLTGGGVGMWEHSLSALAAVIIAANNTVNGRPVLFYKDCTGIDLDGGSVGQFIAVGCENVRLANLTIPPTSQPIILGGVQNFTLSNIVAEGTEWAVTMNSVYGGLIEKSALNGTSGVGMWGAAAVRLEGNRFGRGESGAWLAQSANIELVNNTFGESLYGPLVLYDTYEITLSANRFAGNGVHITGNASSHHIDDTNTVRGRPLVYKRDCSGFVADAMNVGQLIVANCDNVRISNLSVAGSSAGILLSGVRGAQLSNVTVLNASWNGIEVVDSSSVVMERVKVSGTEGQYYTQSGSAILVADSTDVTVVNSTLGPNALSGLAMRGVNGLTIKDNTFLNNSGGGVDLQNVNVGVVSGNALSGNGWAIGLSQDHNITVERNRFASNRQGIYGAITSALIRNNTITSSRETAIVLHGGEGARVENNTIVRNGVGVDLVSSLSDVRIAYNTIDENGFGITMRGSYRGTTVIVENNISRNGVGVSMTSTWPATIYHNRFVNNTRQAVPGAGAVWDLGYPGGGNFWSDYNGTDLCAGAAQNECPDPDGIGDQAYCEAVNGTQTPVLDRYPLIKPEAPPPRPPAPQPVPPQGESLNFVGLAVAALVGLVAAFAAAYATFWRRGPRKEADDLEMLQRLP